MTANDSLNDGTSFRRLSDYDNMGNDRSEIMIGYRSKQAIVDESPRITSPYPNSIHTLDGADTESESGYAIFNFNPRNSQEISIRTGDCIKVLKYVSDSWVQIVKDDERQGLVPMSYIKTFDSIYICQALFTYQAKSPRQISFNQVTNKYALCEVRTFTREKSLTFLLERNVCVWELIHLNIFRAQVFIYFEELMIIGLRERLPVIILLA